MTGLHLLWMVCYTTDCSDAIPYRKNDLPSILNCNLAATHQKWYANELCRSVTLLQPCCNPSEMVCK